MPPATVIGMPRKSRPDSATLKSASRHAPQNTNVSETSADHQLRGRRRICAWYARNAGATPNETEIGERVQLLAEGAAVPGHPGERPVEEVEHHRQEDQADGQVGWPSSSSRSAANPQPRFVNVTTCAANAPAPGHPPLPASSLHLASLASPHVHGVHRVQDGPCPPRRSPRLS